MNKTQGKVHSIISNLVLVRTEGPVSQNEICFIQLGNERLMAEVIKVVGDIAYVQVFESTRGLKPGSPRGVRKPYVGSYIGSRFAVKEF